MEQWVRVARGLGREWGGFGCVKEGVGRASV